MGDFTELFVDASAYMLRRRIFRRIDRILLLELFEFAEHGVIFKVGYDRCILFIIEYIVLFEFLSEELHSFPYLHVQRTSLSANLAFFSSSGKVDDRKKGYDKKETAPQQKVDSEKVSDLRKYTGLRDRDKG